MRDEMQPTDPEDPQLGAIPLVEDEVNHLRRVPEEMRHKLRLAYDGAVLGASRVYLSQAGLSVDTNSAQFMQTLLVFKCANLLRQATRGLLIGYYTGCSILLRVAFESLAYMYLFNHDPDEVKIWLRIELHPGLDYDKRARDRREQFSKAKDAFARRALNDANGRDIIQLLWDEPSQDVHTSAQGMAKRFGLDFLDFLPDEFWLGLEKAEDDWEKALGYLAWKNVDKKSWDIDKYRLNLEREEVEAELMGRFDEEALHSLSMIALLLSHSLINFTSDSFEAENFELNSDFDKWHEESKKINR